MHGTKTFDVGTSPTQYMSFTYTFTLGCLGRTLSNVYLIGVYRLYYDIITIYVPVRETSMMVLPPGES